MKIVRVGQIILALLMMALPGHASAADPIPGSACTVNNASIRSGGPENSGIVYDMTCQGGVWVATLTYLATSSVGIGTTAPVSRLDVSTSAGGIATLGRLSTAVSSADDIGKIQFWNNDSSLSTQNIYGSIGMKAAQNIGTDAAAGNMYFATTSTTAGGSPTTRMVIDSSGNVGIGTTSPQAILDVAGTGSTQSAMLIPRDTTGNRPTAVEGMIRYNTTVKAVEVYQGASYLEWGEIPSLAGKVDLTGQTAAIAPTAIFTPTADGRYKVCTYTNVTTTATGGTMDVCWQYESESGNTAKVTCMITAFAMSTANNSIGDCGFLYIKSGTALQYKTIFTGVTGSPQYTVHLRAYRID